MAVVRTEYRCGGTYGDVARVGGNVPTDAKPCFMGVVKIGRHLKHVETVPITTDDLKLAVRPFEVHARISRYWESYEKGGPGHYPTGGTARTGRKLLDNFEERSNVVIAAHPVVAAGRALAGRRTAIEHVSLTPEQLHEVGLALAQLEAAVMAEPGAFRAAGVDHAHVIGDAAVFALAMRGFVIEHVPILAATVAAEFEREPEQAPKLS